MTVIIFFYAFVFISGLIFGSFLNVVIDRLPFDKSILFPASHCPHCKHKLVITDLVPIFSFVYLGKRCRYCKAPISWYYPLIEAITGVLFVITIFTVLGTAITPFLEGLGQVWQIIYLLFMISILISVFFVDLKYGIIPFKLVIIAFFLLTIQYLITIQGDILNIVNFLLTGFVLFIIFFLIFFISKGRALGFGDVVFSFIMGYILGFPKIILGVYVAFLTGAIISLILVLLNKKRLRGGTIPFGPFLVFATILSLFWGDQIIKQVMVYFNIY